jgi:hypothetical protein
MAEIKIGTERKFIKMLARRENHLRARIAQHGNHAVSYDRHEAAALHWAVSTLEGLLGDKKLGVKE